MEKKRGIWRFFKGDYYRKLKDVFIIDIIFERFKKEDNRFFILKRVLNIYFCDFSPSNHILIQIVDLYY